MAKYELTNKTIKHQGHTLYQIRALENFESVKAGDLGGYVENGLNLSQYGNCWIYNEGKVYNNARVSGNAMIFDRAIVKGSASVTDSAIISDRAIVYDNAHIQNNAQVLGHAIISGNAVIEKDAYILGVALVSGNATIGKRGIVEKRGDYITISNIGNGNSDITVYRGCENNIYVETSDYSGLLKDYRKKIKKSDLTRKMKRIYNYLLKSVALAMK